LVFSTQILNFERSFSLSQGPKAVLFHLAKFLLEALLTVQNIYSEKYMWGRYEGGNEILENFTSESFRMLLEDFLSTGGRSRNDRGDKTSPLKGP
jgi:hypothetical protein